MFSSFVLGEDFLMERGRLSAVSESCSDLLSSSTFQSSSCSLLTRRVCLCSGMELSTSEGRLCLSIEAGALRMPPPTVREPFHGAGGISSEGETRNQNLFRLCFLSAGGLSASSCGAQEVLLGP